MRYYNTSKPSELVGLRSAILDSAQDPKGLFLPEFIPSLKTSFINEISNFNLRQIAYHVARPYLTGDIPDQEIEKIIDEALNFEIPVKRISNNIDVLELFHGPTMAFKDVGARFMAGLFEYLLSDNKKEATILVATSGDTGGAVANAFLNKNGIRVVILYPSKRVSDLQERQLTTLGNNIFAIEIEGNFDDCQALVKKAFASKEINEKLNLISANSINFARLLPQTFYYFHAYAQLEKSDKPLVFSVPSGNFGNLTAGFIAMKMGLPIHKFIAATNTNDIVPKYIHTCRYIPKQSVETISNAMDVGDPSNFKRLLNLNNNSHYDFKSSIEGYSVTDEDTFLTMKSVYQKYNYILDPHGAVGYKALQMFLERNNFHGVFLETAHPIKFSELVEKNLGIVLQKPNQIEELGYENEQSVKMKADYQSLMQYLLESSC